MSKVTEFYKAAIADDAVKQEINDIFGQTKLEDASDEQLEKVGEVAKRLGFDISLEEAREYLNSEHKELSDPELGELASNKVTCNVGIGNINVG